VQEDSVVEHISREDFEANLDQYIPPDLKDYTLVVQDYSCMEIFELHRKANLISLFLRGVDTIRVNPPYPDWEEYDEVKLCKKMLRFEEKKVDALKKKYAKPLRVASWQEINRLKPEQFRYVLKRHIHSTMHHPKLQYATTHLHYIYDRISGSNLAISNHHEIVDWIIK